MFNLLEGAINASPGDKLTQFSTIYSIASVIVNTLLAVSAGMAMVTLGYAFVTFTMAKGDPKLAEKARFAAEWSMVAILLTILAVALKVSIFNAIGVSNAAVNDPGF